MEMSDRQKITTESSPRNRNEKGRRIDWKDYEFGKNLGWAKPIFGETGTHVVEYFVITQNGFDKTSLQKEYRSNQNDYNSLWQCKILS